VNPEVRVPRTARFRMLPRTVLVLALTLGCASNMRSAGPDAAFSAVDAAPSSPVVPDAIGISAPDAAPSAADAGAPMPARSDGGGRAADATSGPPLDGPPAPPPPDLTDPALPPCKRTVPVAGNGPLATALSAAQPGDCLLLAGGSYA